jgi:hypothetical protein
MTIYSADGPASVLSAVPIVMTLPRQATALPIQLRAQTRGMIISLLIMAGSV